jgi:Stress responsive A/B Barrel Domain
MVKHLVMWRLRDRVRAANGLENEVLIKRAVDAMRSGIEGLRALEIGINKGAASDSADLALYSEFESWEALQAYELHPLHEDLKKLIGPLRTERRVVDYETA